MLQIRYIKLHFTLILPEDCILPVSKASAIRGGIGEMLLRMNCISDRNCAACGFESECIVQRTMYSKFEHKPSFITSGDSAGYVLECEDYREDYSAGDTLSFNLILFGRTVVYFNSFLQAVAMLGQNGLGKSRAHFVISGITNTRGEKILDGSDILMSNYRIHTIADYVEFRKREFAAGCEDVELVFKTPVTIKYRGDFLTEFNTQAIIRAVQRRIYILDCFENIEGEDYYRRDVAVPELVDQSIRPISVRRYSNRSEQAMWLHGIKGTVQLKKVEDDVLEILLAGEVLHIGKNTSFGFGRYVIRHAPESM